MSTKLIALGLSVGVAGVGAGSLIKYPRYEYSKTIGQASLDHTSDLQWRFLYLLAGKVFDYLKSQEDSDNNINAKDKESVIDWLKTKLDLSNLNISNTGQGFRDLCSQSIKEENLIDGFEVNKPESRFCFMGSGELDAKDKPSAVKLQLYISEKNGHIGNISRAQNSGSNEEQSAQKSAAYSNLNAFANGQKSNFSLGEDFKKQKENELNNSNYETKGNEGYQNAEISFRTSSGGSGNESTPTKLAEALKVTSTEK